MLLLAVALLIWGAWEGFRALGIRYGWTRPFTVDATTMPHIHSMIQALFERPNPEAPLLIVNSDRLNFHESQEDLALLMERIAAMRGPREFFSLGG